MTIHEQAIRLKRWAYVFIAKKQNKHGGFISQTNTDQGLREHHTIFYPALISTILAEIPKEEQEIEHERINTHLKNFWLLQPNLNQKVGNI